MFGVRRQKTPAPVGAKPVAESAGAVAPSANLPIRAETRQDRSRTAYFSKGQFLARQDRWDMLGRLIAETDRTRATTPSGEALAAVLAVGARDDAVRHARSAIQSTDCPVPMGVEALTEIAEEHPESWAIHLVAARAQMDCAWAYEGQIDPYALPFAPSDAFMARFDVASELIARAEELCPTSAEVAAAKCDLLAAVPEAGDLVDALHRDVIAADPTNPGRLRNYGVHLLPRWFGSYSDLSQTSADLGAEMAADWGESAYAWMWFDALRLDPEAGAVLDAEYFVAGLHSILDRTSDAHLANLIAAYVDGMKPAAAPDDLSPDAMKARRLIHAALPDLTERHLTELHPQVWARADALPGATHAGPLSSGRIAAATAQAKSAVDAAVAARALAADQGIARRA
ncbi:hypothetical protein [Pseudooceanicola sp. MF1-13]|uniref:hypothetical protein n=1 Tax=Pseudooceanicola sp. MF1-13 TaxID=3379095 RepID=UPI0038912FAD